MQLVERGTSAELGRVLIIGVQLHLAHGQFADDAEQALDGDGRGSGTAHLGFHTTSNSDVEVSRREVKPVVLCTEMDIRQDGQGGPRAHDVLDGLQPGDQLVFGDAQFHDY